MVSKLELPGSRHNWKQAIVDAAETDTVFPTDFPDQGSALRTDRTTELEHQDHVGMGRFGRALGPLLGTWSVGGN
jgi:hypothetical protein